MKLPKKIYLDMDGVLADFVRHFDKTIHHGGLEKSKFKEYQEHVLAINDWWFKMPLMGDAKELVNYITKANGVPHILSAAPSWNPEAKEQKIRWILKYFDIPRKNILVVKRADKQNYAEPGAILIDDFDRNIKEWHAAGGDGIVHKSAGKTIAELRKLGIQ